MAVPFDVGVVVGVVVDVEDLVGVNVGGCGSGRVESLALPSSGTSSKE